MIRINLLPVRAERRQQALRQQFLLVLGVLLVLAVGLVSVHLTLAGEVSDLEQKIQQRKTKIAELQKTIGEVRQYKQKKRDLEEKIEVIAQLEARQRGPSQVLYALAKIMPEKMWIERLSDTGGGLALKGFAIDNQTIARFMTRMQASPRFTGVRLEETRQINRGGVNLKSFSIKASVQYPEAG